MFLSFTSHKSDLHINAEFLFVSGVRLRSNFLFWSMWLTICSGSVCWKEPSFPPLICNVTFVCIEFTHICGQNELAIMLSSLILGRATGAVTAELDACLLSKQLQALITSPTRSALLLGLLC